MYYLLKKSMYSAADHQSDWAGHTKHYQHIEFERIARLYPDALSVGEIGAKAYFKCLLSFLSAKRFIVDPYDGAPGGGLSDIPKLPFPVGLFRCYIGAGESVIPDGFFDLTFSISVIEHIGQVETGYDRAPAMSPPPEQESPRDKFCNDLFRITAPGGVTLHSVDHAARNRSFAANFLRAGFEPIRDDALPSVEECMNDRDNVVQMMKWGKRSNEPSEPEDWALDSVLMMGFRRPLD